jgi:hypothetical protein
VSECEFCEEKTEDLTTCQYCAQEFCSDCGDTESEMCFDCVDDADEVAGKELDFEENKAGPQKCDLGPICKQFLNSHITVLKESCAVCEHLHYYAKEPICEIEECERKRKIFAAQRAIEQTKLEVPIV